MDSGADLNEDNPAQFWSTTVYGRLSRFCDAERHGSAELCASVRQALRAERAAMEAELRTLDLRIFALSPAHPSRLPPEVLVHIFSYLFAVRPDLLCYNIKDPQLVQWARVTHVCRRWREVALDTPSLWRNIVVPLKSAEWSQTILHRVQLVPIILFWLGRNDQQAPALPVDDLARVEQLKLSQYNGEGSALVKLLRTPAPLLEVAEVSCKHVDMSSADLFAGHAPRLRRLHLLHLMSFPWNSPILSNLVCLEIRNDALEMTGHCSWKSVLLALQKMPTLETLALSNCLPPFPSNVGCVEAFIVVPSRLKVLQMHGLLQDCVGFLQHFRCPAAGIHLALRCFTPGVATDFSTLFPVLVAAGGASSAAFVEFVFCMESAEDLTVEGQRAVDWGAATPPIFAWEGYRTSRSLHLNLTWEDRSGWNAVDLMRELCKTLSVKGLRKLDVDIVETPPGARRQEVTREDWLDIFGSATRLREVRGWGPAARSLCRALLMTTVDRQAWRSGLGGPWSTFFLPRLHTLGVGVYGQLRHFFPEEGLHLDDLLVRALKTRAANDAPVHTLELSQATHALEGALHGVVDSVIVEQYE